MTLDLEQLRLEYVGTDPGPSLTAINHRSAQRAPYIKGPIPLEWMKRASALSGKALAVALVIWYIAGLRKSPTNLPVTGKVLKAFSVGRKAGYRGLVALEVAGLVTVRREPGRCPCVTLCCRTV